MREQNIKEEIIKKINKIRDKDNKLDFINVGRGKIKWKDVMWKKVLYIQPENNINLYNDIEYLYKLIDDNKNGSDFYD